MKNVLDNLKFALQNEHPTQLVLFLPKTETLVYADDTCRNIEKILQILPKDIILKTKISIDSSGDKIPLILFLVMDHFSREKINYSYFLSILIIQTAYNFFSVIKSNARHIKKFAGY